MKKNCTSVTVLLLFFTTTLSCDLSNKERVRLGPPIETISTRQTHGQINRVQEQETMIKGGLMGPMAGGAIGHYVSDTTRTQAETNKRYGYAYDRGTAARIESLHLRPRFVRPGDRIDIKATYLVLSFSTEPTLVREIREIWYGENLWGNPEVRVERTGGTYESSIALHLPDDLKPGTYTLRYIVRTPSSRDVRETNFTVRQ